MVKQKHIHVLFHYVKLNKNAKYPKVTEGYLICGKIITSIYNR